MGKMFRWLASFIFGDNFVTYSESDYEKTLFSEIEKEEDKEEKLDSSETLECKCEHRIGKITSLQPNYGLIDGRFYFEIGDVEQKNVKVGQAVRYLAYRNNENVEWKVKQISVIEPDEWENERNEDPVSRVTEEHIAIKKTLTAQIVDRRNRTLTMIPNDIICDLDRVECEFLPVKGDWVSLTAMVEVREDDRKSVDHIIDIEVLKPLRHKMFEGKVSHLSNVGSGIIGNQVYFTENVCADGCMPGTNDRVAARAIESEQGALLWRAVHVRIIESASSEGTLMDRIAEERLFDSKFGVIVSATCDKMNLKIGGQTTFRVNVENAGNQDQTLTSIVLKNSLYSNVMKMMTESFEPIVIPSGTSYALEVLATARSSGYYTEIMVLHFEGDWQIGYMLDIYVHMENECDNSPVNHAQARIDDVSNNNNSNNSNNKKNNNTNESNDTKRGRNTKNSYYAKRELAKLKTMPTKTGFIVPGVRPVKPAAFLPKVLPEFPIPETLRAVIVGDGNTYRSRSDISTELEETFPCLAEELSDRNYLQKFHLLLHLEDLELSIAIKKFDSDRVSFIRRGEFLVLEIPNLAESRPSLVVGDKLIATELVTNQNQADSVSYEGYIHKIANDSIKLKFGDTFHNNYDGKSMNVTFIHSRTAIKRAHQALNEVFKHLGPTWLFPNAARSSKADQVNIVGENPPKNVSDRKHVCESVRIESTSVTQSVVKGSKLKPLRKKRPVTLADLDDSESEASDTEESSGNSSPPLQHMYSNVKRPACADRAIQWEEERQPPKRDAVNKENEPPKPKEKSNAHVPDVLVRWVNPELNKYQRAAVRNILKGEARPLPYIIQGPPGTGKTITVVETILQITFLMPESRILVATPSNSSADLLCERLLSWNLLKAGDLVRLVGYNYMVENRMSSIIKPYCTCIDTKSTDKNVFKTYCDDDGVKYSSREVVGRHRITVSTCVATGGLYMMGFPKNHFTHVIIDEAGQASEPDIMIPLAFLNKEEGQAILAGDPRQLGPVITSIHATEMGLDQSFLSRLSIRFPYQRDPEGYPETNGFDPRLVTRLLFNYRSLPNILELYSSLFYNSELLPKVCDKCSTEIHLFNKIKHRMREDAWHEGSQVIFHGVKGVDLQDADSPSWYNDHEIARVINYVSSLYLEGLESSDIGIVTPYQKQVHKLREMLRNCELELPKVGTVEEFQGQERNVIIISTVRSNSHLVERDVRHSLGFVSSQQRLNVAISRARALLIIIGNPHLLYKDTMWRRLITLCKQKNYYFGCDLPNSLSD